MYIADGELASAFHFAEKEYISETENIILEEYRSRLNSGMSQREAKKSWRDAAIGEYKEFVREFVKEYKDQYKAEHGNTYGTDHPQRKNVFSA